MLKNVLIGAGIALGFIGASYMIVDIARTIARALELGCK